MERSKTWSLVVAALAVIVAVTIVSPALGGPSLRQLVKKEVARQINRATGPQGPPGQQGPKGPAGTFPTGQAPTESSGPISASSGSTVELASVSFAASEPHRLTLAGGFNTVCNPCTSVMIPSWSLSLEGGATLVSRRMSPLADTQTAGASLGEVVVSPSVCGPCTFNLSIVVPASPPAATLDTTAIRLALVDLGPVAP